MPNYRSQITRSNMNNNNAEIASQFYWSLDVIKFAPGVYFPGNEIFYQRLVSVSGLPKYQHDVQTVEVGGGFKVLQPGGVDHSNGSVQFTFQDYIDQSIAYLFTDYMNKIEDPETKVGLSKEYLVSDFDVYQLNAALQPIKKFMLRTGMPTDPDTGEDFGVQKTPNGKVTVTFQFEWWDIKFLNTTPITNE